ncbi:YlxR family protein [bacterium]|nr:MAG: YlxR family protein [bacterium]
MPAPLRTCIGCGLKAARSEFWRFKSKSGAAPVFDPSDTQAGRGASVCQRPLCIEKAIARRAFERNLKLKQPLSSGFKDQLRQLNAESGLKANS